MNFDDKRSVTTEREIELLRTLQKIIGHSNCYCAECRALAIQYWAPDVARRVRCPSILGKKRRES